MLPGAAEQRSFICYTSAYSIGREKSAKELDCTELRVTSLSDLWGWIITNPSH